MEQDKWLTTPSARTASHYGLANMPRSKRQLPPTSRNLEPKPSITTMLIQIGRTSLKWTMRINELATRKNHEIRRFCALHQIARHVSICRGPLSRPFSTPSLPYGTRTYRCPNYRCPAPQFTPRPQRSSSGTSTGSRSLLTAYNIRYLFRNAGGKYRPKPLPSGLFLFLFSFAPFIP